MAVCMVVCSMSCLQDTVEAHFQHASVPPEQNEGKEHCFEL